MKRPPMRSYQREAVDFALANRYSILGLDPGLGKSRCLIEVREKTYLNCLIICPSYLISNWEKELKKWAPKNSDIVTFSKGSELFDVVDADYIITSYGLIQKAPYLMEWADMIGIDEAHELKNMAAKRSQFIHKEIFENSVQRVHLLSGTIIKNRVQEFYSPLAIACYNPRATDQKFLDQYPSEIDFADHFARRREFKIKLPDGRRIPVVKWEGLRRVKELKRHLEGKFIRIKADDVLDLPPVIHKPVLISKFKDKKLLAAFESYFGVNEDHASVKPQYKAEAALKKTPFTIKYATNLLDEAECALIYSDHVESCKAIAQHFGVPAITGQMSAKKRSKLADAFQSGEGKIICATIGSLSTGKDLYRANQMILNDPPWVPGDLDQLIRRMQRLGQTKACTLHNIFGSPQDEYIYNVIKEKSEDIRRAT